MEIGVRQSRLYERPFSVDGKVYLGGRYSFIPGRFTITLTGEEGQVPMTQGEWNKVSSCE